MINNYNEIIGCIGGLLLSIQLLPQIIKAYRTKKTKDVSLSMIVISIIGSIIIIYYGNLINSISILITEILSLLLKIILFIYKIKYG